MLLNPVNLHTPRSLQEAIQLYSTLEDVKILAGGTFLLNSLKLMKKKGIKTAANIISLKKVPELQGISRFGNILKIGAATVINDLADSSLLVDNFSILKTVCTNISTQPIRNMATVGGNLTCRYTWTEMGAVMIALKAQMHFMNPPGKEVVCPAETFFLNAAKSEGILTHVTIAHEPRMKISYQRVKKTMHVDVPLLALCISGIVHNNAIDDTRVAINNGHSFAQRDLILEGFLNKNNCSQATVSQALNHLNTEIYDKRSDEYKTHMFRVCIKNALTEIFENPSQ